MPMPCNLETTIIDNLVICFLAAPALLAELRDLFGIDYGDFRLSRIEGRFHRHYFNITTPRARKLGSLYFDRFASDGNERYKGTIIEPILKNFERCICLVFR